MTLTCLEKASLVVLAAIGLRFLLRVSILVWKKVIGPSFGFGIDLRTQGKWAVITGATSGIGKAYAEQLAEKGLSIVLVSRSQAKLEQVAVEIKQRYGVEVRIVEADLTEGQVAYTRIAKATEELEVFVLSPFSYPLSLSFLFRSIHLSGPFVRSFLLSHVPNNNLYVPFHTLTRDHAPTPKIQTVRFIISIRQFQH